MNDTYTASIATMGTNYNSIPTVEDNKENFNKWKLSALKRQNFKKTYPVQHIQPIPIVDNLNSVLDNVQDNTEDLHKLVLVDTAKTVKNKYKCISKFCKNKITIIGDTHARGLCR
jgi:hypothetical protein